MKKFRTNGGITASEVRVLDERKNMLGVMSIEKAIDIANESGLDLVEISPDASPPVCKITNFGRMKYQAQKKAADARKKQKIIELKEIKLSSNIGRGDYNFKMKNARKFIEKGDKVKFSLRIKGREITHLEFSEQIMKDVVVDMEDITKIDQESKLEGRRMTLILSPK